MGDTKVGWWPQKFCAICGIKGCTIMHWGPLMRGAVVYLDGCLPMIPEGTLPTFNCGTGERLVPLEPKEGVLGEEGP